ncbi:hypothetical protein NDA16_002087 [Ustilago loliicola]|nr:hypothetical protein NDA16_002087 [Ustilago loliicola]
MASRIPDETLSKVLEKIQLQVYQTNQQLAALRAQISAREREAKLNTLTLTELKAVEDPNAPFYRSVGKITSKNKAKTLKHTSKTSSPA